MNIDKMTEIGGVAGKTLWINLIKTPGQLVENFCLQYVISIGKDFKSGIIKPVLDNYQKSSDMVYLSSRIPVPMGSKLYLKPINSKDEFYSGDVFVTYNLSI